MTDLNALVAANAKRWANAELSRKAEAIAVATHLIGAKDRYQAVESKTGVPWAIVALIHEREASQDWTASLAQGDSWNRVSVHVPTGRGPFKSWQDAAVDALIDCPPYLARHKEWSLVGALTALESYNGLGYASRGVPSPYLWSGTDQYISGKFVRDGVYDPNKVDPQLGCAALLMAMMALDPTVTFTAVKIIPPKPVPPAVPASQPISWWVALVKLVFSIFKRKQ